jgi:hypothetical protein
VDRREVDDGALAAVLVVDVVVGCPVVLRAIVVEEVSEPVSATDFGRQRARPAVPSTRHRVRLTRPVVDVTDHVDVGFALVVAREG